MLVPADIHGARILIVDDGCDTASTLSELLKWRGYSRVSWTSDSKAVPRLVTMDPVDLLLLDMHMPDLCGLEVMQKLDEMAVTRSIQVIAFSGDHRYRTVSVAAGACAFLIKPFQHEELETTMLNALSKATSPPARQAIGARPLRRHAQFE